jgi:hypothetical protein
MKEGINRELLDRVYNAVLEEGERGEEFREILQTGSRIEKLDAFYERGFTQEDMTQLGVELDKLFAEARRVWWAY